MCSLESCLYHVFLKENVTLGPYVLILQTMNKTYGRSNSNYNNLQYDNSHTM
jgi:hypothetical protein